MNPTIASDGWGEILITTVNNTIKYRDCKLFPGGSSKWDWNLTDTHHKPGIQKEDLIDSNTEKHLKDSIVLLSQGRDGVLEITPELIEYLKENNIEYFCDKTDKIIRLYNILVKSNKKVIALIHTTC